MYIKTILILLLTLLNIKSDAQVEKKLQGTIIDSNTNLPIEGVYLKLSNNASNAVTNKLRYFSMLLTNNTSSNDRIFINALGYKSIKIATLKLNNEPIKLYEDIVTLPEVIVQSLFNWENFAKKVKLDFATVLLNLIFKKTLQ